MRNAEHPDVEGLVLTSVLAAMADPVRMHLVQTLANGREMAWSDLDVPVGKSTLSHHLKTLRSAGVTQTRQEGTRCFVRLRIDDLEHRFPGVLQSILAAADPPPDSRINATTTRPPTATSLRATPTRTPATRPDHRQPSTYVVEERPVARSAIGCW